MIGYIKDEIPISKEYGKALNEKVTHYNFTKSGEKTGFCSHCGTGLNSTAKECNLCGTKLVPKRIIKTSKPKNFDQEIAFRVCQKYNDTFIYRFILAGICFEDDFVEKSYLNEVERISYTGPNDSLLIMSNYGHGWNEGSKYYDYIYGSSTQVKQRTTVDILPNHKDFEKQTKDSDIKYTCFDKYYYRHRISNAYNLFQNISIAAHYRFVEYLWKLSFYVLYESVFNCKADMRLLSENKIKEYIKDLRAIGNPTFAQYYLLNYCKRNNVKIRTEDIKPLPELYDIDNVKNIIEAANIVNITIGKAISYCTKVLFTDSINTSEWLDELTMLQEMNGYIPHKKTYPSDLRTQHQETIVVYNTIKKEIEEKKAIDSIAKMQELEYQNNDFGLAIIAPKSLSDIVDEGAAMNHCVGNSRYLGEVTDRKTMIFFLRYTDKPDQSLGTIELKNNKIIQCQGKDNISKNLPENYQPFLNDWLEKKVEAFSNA